VSVSRAVRLANLSAGLGVARWSRWLLTMGVVAACCLGVGLWAGVRWERGAQALSELQDTRAQIGAQQNQIEALHTAALEIRDNAVNAAQDYRTAAMRMEDIANAYALHDQTRLRALDRALDEARAPLLRDRADLWACDIGQQLLDHWNRAARGPGAASAAAAAAADPADAAGAVRSAAPGDRQPGAGAAGEPRPTDGGAPRLRQPAQPPG
jgi:hypothetical protein